MTYLNMTRQRPEDFARKVPCTARSLYNYMNGRLPRYAIAMRIIELSKGMVKFDLGIG